MAGQSVSGGGSAAWLLVLGPLLAASSPSAGAPPEAAPGRAGFWDRVADPHRERFERLMRDAESDLAVARQTASRSALAQAEARLGEALKLKPEDHLAHLMIGDVQASLGRAAEAVSSFERARELGRLPAQDAACSFRLGVERSKLGRYAEALADYDRQVRLGPVDGRTYSNSAELLMALGRVSEAEDRYREAIRHDLQSDRPDRENGVTLGYYGLAVALDRDEQPAAAREAMAQALHRDRSLALLRSALEPDADVFFLPEGDVYYYLGLAREVEGRQGDAEADFRRYLGAQSGSPWARRAQTHIDTLVAARAGASRQVDAAPGGPPAPGQKGRSGASLSLRTVATVSTRGPIASPVLDAAWRERPPAVESCFGGGGAKGASAAEGVRLVLDVVLDGKGVPARVRVRAPHATASLAACVEAAVKTGLRVPQPARARPTTARVVLFLAPP